MARTRSGNCFLPLIDRFSLFVTQPPAPSPMAQSNDNCEHDFQTLATEVLPQYFSRLQDSITAPIPTSWIRESGVGKLTI